MKVVVAFLTILALAVASLVGAAILHSHALGYLCGALFGVILAGWFLQWVFGGTEWMKQFVKNLLGV